MTLRRSLADDFAAAGLDWIVPEWPAPSNVQAFSTTRNRGPAGRRSPTGEASDDDPTDELERWVPAPPRWLRQVHGATVHDADESAAAASPPRADGIVTRSCDLVCVIQTADCLPVLLADRSGSVVAAAHAGWRGLAAGVIEATLAAMRADPGDVLAWIGPAIGPRAYEVGADVLEAHRAADSGADECFVSIGPDKWLADLRALARRRLARAGVRSVAGEARCTFTESALFHSYRRDGARAGRMVTLIWRSP
ncbi:MAG TPA: peptidoglycan editing factor PgeF [Casimicrobiaceae bacterium]|nr:peptidoglycan editing factor PgeF [Casimicrobiaceae bacterium]